MTTGERIKQVRKSQKMTQAEFANEIAVSTTTVCQLEVGRYNISRSTKHILCSRFHINPDWLDTGEGEMYVEANTVEYVVPQIAEVLTDNPSLLTAVSEAMKTFTVDDWKKVNLFFSKLSDPE